jgi:protein-tyrosine phosphatase
MTSLIIRRSIVLVLLLSIASTAAAGIGRAACELVRPGVYRIDFDAAAAPGPIVIYASSKPDALDGTAPVATAERSPVEVAVPGRIGRVYFHLKPASGSTRVVSLRRLPLEGASNFRDLGGYQTSDGRYVRWGRVYRSNHLVDLTASDYAYLNGLGIRLVCDFRTGPERQQSPTKWQGGSPEFLVSPVVSDTDLARAMSPASADEFKERMAIAVRGDSSGEKKWLETAYSRFVVESYEPLLHRLAAGETPVVSHCTAGRDRTGVFSAILLTALGVPRNVVVEDFLLTNHYWLTDASIEQMRLTWQKQYGLEHAPDAALVRTMMTLHAETLEATFDRIVKKYGSFEAYLQNGLHLSSKELLQLRTVLLEE